MCGISGIWNYKTGRPVDMEKLWLITQLLAHRGPDGEGYHTSNGLGLGHRRLSIIDIEGGRQPMCNEDGSVWIVFNGEIYNHPELRQELEGHGHTFRTNSDTEAIVHLYEDYGDGCFERLRGMFALALWDERKQQLLLARDRLGIKPLFYGLGKDGIVFGSELKCIWASGLVEREVDATAIADLFTFFYIPGPKTIYRNVYSLDPGAYLRVDENGISKRKYWDLKEGQLSLSSEHEYEERLLAILRESVKSHLLSDVPVGAFLSGGVDSSSVVALMSECVGDPIMTCTIGFNEEEYNELPRARTVARKYGTSHHEQVVQSEPAKLLERLVDSYDQPFPDHSSIPTFYVSQLASKRVKVVLSGDGGDENFAGYSRYRRQLALERIRRSVPGVFLDPFRSWAGNRENGNLSERLCRILHHTAIGARESYLHGITIADASLRSRVFSADLKHELADYDPLDTFRDIYNRAPASDFLSRICYLDLKTYLVDDILTKVDRASMANSLEVRVPLLDHKVVEFAYSLPLHMKLRNGKGKYLLRKTMSSFLPLGFLDTRKMGFRIPIVPWLRGELRPWAEDILLRDSLATPFMDTAGVGQVWNWFQQGRVHLGDLLGILLSFALSSSVWGTDGNFGAKNKYLRRRSFHPQRTRLDDLRLQPNRLPDRRPESDFTY
jgi:asparagine synthase (glutamine-hydrolysing)